MLLMPAFHARVRVMGFRASRAAVLPTMILWLSSPACELVAPLTPVPNPSDHGGADGGTGGNDNGTGGNGGTGGNDNGTGGNGQGGAGGNPGTLDAGSVSVSLSGTPCTSAEAAMAFPATPILDRFDGPAGPLDADWIGTTSSFAVGGGRLVGLESGDPLFWNAEFAASQEAYATFSKYDPDLYDMRLALKGQSPNAPDSTDAECNAFYVEYSISNGDGLNVGYCVEEGNFVIDIGSGGYLAMRPGDELGARVFSDGCVVVLVNRQPVLLTSTGGFPFNGRSGYIGLFSQFAKDQPGTSSEWDDFGGGSLP
jgi:hypothetical protein